MSETTKALEEKLFFSPKKAYGKDGLTDRAKADEYAEGYIDFLNSAKTEREAVTKGIAMAKAAGFSEYHFGDKLVSGGRYFYNNRGKSLYVFCIGSDNPEKGIKISASHVDCPRLDLKPCPLYEDSGIAYLKTHYYGGIKKYQWVTIPLALHGVIVKNNGESVDVRIGDDESDPVLYISDILPHLAKDQNSRSMGDGIPGEKLNIIIGTEPYGEDGSVKLNIMNILNEKYGITEEDFISAELCAVPAEKARFIGLDKSLIGGYGHDDRVCSYPALTAVIDAAGGANTVMAVFADKEEVGSIGATGMQSDVLDDLIEEIASAFGANVHTVREHSSCLSADVNAAYDPNFAEAYERRNSCFVNGGVVLTKYTGSRGKSGSNDASAEFVAKVRKVFEDSGVVWQIGELGKVDQGGGGTVALYIAQKNIDTVDLGVPVLSMHAPYECISKSDLYNTYKAFLAFNKA